MLRIYRQELGDKVRDPQRLRAVYGSHFMSGRSGQQLNALCQAAAQVTRSPRSLISLITEEHEIVVASYGEPQHRLNLSESWCVNQIMGDEDHLSIEDSLRNALVCYTMPTMENGRRAYLGVPLIDDDGNILGTLCVYDFVPRKWSETDVHLLTTLASTVMGVEKAAHGGTS